MGRTESIQKMIKSRFELSYIIDSFWRTTLLLLTTPNFNLV